MGTTQTYDLEITERRSVQLVVTLCPDSTIPVDLYATYGAVYKNMHTWVGGGKLLLYVDGQQKTFFQAPPLTPIKYQSVTQKPGDPDTTVITLTTQGEGPLSLSRVGSVLTVTVPFAATSNAKDTAEDPSVYLYGVWYPAGNGRTWLVTGKITLNFAATDQKQQTQTPGIKVCSVKSI